MSDKAPGPVVAAENLEKIYAPPGGREVRALDGVSFTLSVGEFVAVMGASGSGKSTLLNLTGGIDTPTAGRVTVEGADLMAMDDESLTLFRRKKIGFIFQFFNLMPTLTAFENVALPLLIEGARLKEREKSVNDMLARVGLSDRAGHRPDQLSGGERQRVAVARALLNNPPLLLADEPTGNLDTANGREILKLLRQACDDWGHAALMVTHDPAAAMAADRIIFLRDGKIDGEEAVDRNDNDRLMKKLSRFARP